MALDDEFLIHSWPKSGAELRVTFLLLFLVLGPVGESGKIQPLPGAGWVCTGGGYPWHRQTVPGLTPLLLTFAKLKSL